MTFFYRFPESKNFPSEFVREDGINISVIGDKFDEEGNFVEYLVNASGRVEEWDEFETFPTSPMRIFG